MASKPSSAVDAPPQSSSGATQNLSVLGREFSSELERQNFRQKVLAAMFLRQVQFNFVPFGVQQFVPTEDEEIFLQRNISVSFLDTIAYACRTIAQHRNTEWNILRRVRISSSRAHPITSRTNAFAKLAYEIANPRFTGNAATEYGNKMENAARCAFKYQINLEVMNCGVVIRDTHPWLCCSPDGIVLGPTPALLEIKCPDSRKGLEIVDRDRKVSYVDYLHYVGNELRLRVNHTYYTQIQLSLFILKLDTCFLYVYSTKDHVQIEVPIDREFLSVQIPKMEFFYYRYYLQALMVKYGHDYRGIRP